MIVRREAPMQTVSGLRTRYVPKSRISQGIVGIAAWVDIVMLMMMFVLFNGTMTIRPGVVINLAQAPLHDGTRGGLIAVVLSVAQRPGEPIRELVFFDDERFRVDRSEDVAKLRAAFRRQFNAHSGEHLVIQADTAVDQGTVMLLVNMASDMGVDRVNISSRPPINR